MEGAPGRAGSVPGIAGTDSTPSVCVQLQGEQKSQADLAASAGSCSPSPDGGSRVSFVLHTVYGGECWEVVWRRSVPVAVCVVCSSDRGLYYFM